MDVGLISLHSNPADCSDPAYWIDWAVDDLAYSVLANVLGTDGLPPSSLESIADHFRHRLKRSRGLLRLIELSEDPLEIEQSLRVCAEAFCQVNYPDIDLGYVPPPQKVELQELARYEAAAGVLRIAADIIAPTSRATAALLDRCARKEEAAAERERGRLRSRKSIPADDIVAAVESSLEPHAAPDVRRDIASDLLECLLDEAMVPSDFAARVEHRGRT